MGWNVAVVVTVLTVYGVVAQASVIKTSDSSSAHAVQQNVTTEQAPANVGILSKLFSFLSLDNIRFLGWGKPAQEVASAECFENRAKARCYGVNRLKNLLAAVHVSKKLGIPFDALRAKIDSGKSLHQAIQELTPGGDYSAIIRQAEEQATKELNEKAS